MLQRAEDFSCELFKFKKLKTPNISNKHTDIGYSRGASGHAASERTSEAAALHSTQRIRSNWIQFHAQESDEIGRGRVKVYR